MGQRGVGYHSCRLLAGRCWWRCPFKMSFGHPHHDCAGSKTATKPPLKLGADHYFHALGYFILAARKIGVNETAAGEFTPPKAEIQSDPHTYDLPGANDQPTS